MKFIQKLLPSHSQPTQDVSIALLIVRIWLGGMMMRYTYTIIFSGSEMTDVAKYLETLNIPLPMIMAYVSKSTEFFGGMLILIGCFTRISASLLFINFVVAVFVANSDKILDGGALAFNYLILSLTVALLGAGKYSLDWKLFGQKSSSDPS